MSMSMSRSKIILAIILLTTFIATTATTTRVSWFREKYLKQIYHEYYIYSYERHSLGDNHIDVCPDIHTSAIMYAMTGISDFGKVRVSKLPPPPPPRILLVASESVPNSTQSEFTFTFTFPKPHGIYILDITLRDILGFIWNITNEIFKMAFMAVNIAILVLFYLILIMLIFCQY